MHPPHEASGLEKVVGAVICRLRPDPLPRLRHAGRQEGVEVQSL